MENLYLKMCSIKKGDSEENIKIELYGVTSSFLLSYNIFKKNSEIKEFLEGCHPVFGEIKPYVYVSRTLLIGRVLRIIEKETKLFNYHLALDMKSYLEKKLDKKAHEERKKTSPNVEHKKNYTDQLFDRFKRED